MTASTQTRGYGPDCDADIRARLEEEYGDDLKDSNKGVKIVIGIIIIIILLCL
jgi:hypothetical protein